VSVASLDERQGGEHQTTQGLRFETGLLWLMPGLLLMVILFIAPIALMILASFTDPAPGLQNYAHIFSDTLYLKVLRNTLVSAVGATIGCLAIGYPTAYAIYCASGRKRMVMLSIVLFSYAVGTVPRAFSWLVVLGGRGIINQLINLFRVKYEPVPLIYNQFGVLVGMVHVMLPFMTLMLLGSMMRINPNLEAAARTLGASRLKAFFTIFLPLTRPGVIAGAMLIFVYSLGFYVVPAVLGGASETTVVMLISDLALRLGLWGIAAALSTLVVVLSIVGASFYVRFTGLSNVYARE
jgi:putative spermidine/putrescine transport system permease protein